MYMYIYIYAIVISSNHHVIYYIIMNITDLYFSPPSPIRMSPYSAPRPPAPWGAAQVPGQVHLFAAGAARRLVVTGIQWSFFHG